MATINGYIDSKYNTITPEYCYAVVNPLLFKTTSSADHFFKDPNGWFKTNENAPRLLYDALHKISQKQPLTKEEQSALDRHTLLEDYIPILKRPPCSISRVVKQLFGFFRCRRSQVEIAQEITPPPPAEKPSPPKELPEEKKPATPKALPAVEAPSPLVIPTGIRNVGGNDCPIISVIQCLRVDPRFGHWFTQPNSMELRAQLHRANPSIPQSSQQFDALETLVEFLICHAPVKEEHASAHMRVLSLNIPEGVETFLNAIHASLGLLPAAVLDGSAPKALWLHLKRFNKNRTKFKGPIIPENSIDLFGSTYQLKAFVEHAGELNAGHYTACVHLGGDQFYHCNDNRVTPIGRQEWERRAMNSYLLLYLP